MEVGSRVVDAIRDRNGGIQMVLEIIFCVIGCRLVQVNYRWGIPVTV